MSPISPHTHTQLNDSQGQKGKPIVVVVWEMRRSTLDLGTWHFNRPLVRLYHNACKKQDAHALDNKVWRCEAETDESVGASNALASMLSARHTSCSKSTFVQEQVEQTPPPSKQHQRQDRTTRARSPTTTLTRFCSSLNTNSHTHTRASLSKPR